MVRFRCIRSNRNARKRHETGNGNTGYPSCFRNGLTCFCHVSVYGFLQFRPVIERVEGPTPWVSPIVVVPKPNKLNEIRICVDMRSLNKAIIRERHIIPTIDDVVSDLNDCKVFSKIDLNQGYHQIPLHPDSRALSTFSIHIGLFQYKRLNFGLSCAAEIFQKKVGDAILGIPCVKNISDDIYVGQTRTLMTNI